MGKTNLDAIKIMMANNGSHFSRRVENVIVLRRFDKAVKIKIAVYEFVLKIS